MSEVELSEPSAGGYHVTLPTFEGPLDLLLHLCQKHELDILDIPIAFITEKYLEYLAVLQLINLDVASEYLVMAATLAHIKSKMLLPAPPPGQEDEVSEEEQDPRESLIRRLLEYQKYKKAGEELAARGVAGSDVFLRGMPIEQAIETGLPPLAQVPLFSLVEAFQNILEKSKVKLSHDIVHEGLTLVDRINELVDLLRVHKRLAFEELFEGQQNRFDLIITFLALLEMTRLRMTRLFQTDFHSPIFVEFTAQVGSQESQEEEVHVATPSAPGQSPTVPSQLIEQAAADEAQLALEAARRGAPVDDDEIPPSLVAAELEASRAHEMDTARPLEAYKEDEVATEMSLEALEDLDDLEALDRPVPPSALEAPPSSRTPVDPLEALEALEMSDPPPSAKPESTDELDEQWEDEP